MERRYLYSHFQSLLRKDSSEAYVTSLVHLRSVLTIFFRAIYFNLEAISRLRIDLFEANRKIKSLEETILRDRSCIWEKQNSLQAQIDSLMPGSDTLGTEYSAKCSPEPLLLLWLLI